MGGKISASVIPKSSQHKSCRFRYFGYLWLSLEKNYARRFAKSKTLLAGNLNGSNFLRSLFEEAFLRIFGMLVEISNRYSVVCVSPAQYSSNWCRFEDEYSLKIDFKPKICYHVD